jgi:signal peptidase I
VAAVVGGVAAIQTWVVSLYRIGGPSMEPTLHCAAPTYGCRAETSDRVLANRLAYRFRNAERGDIVAFDPPPQALALCGATGIFVKRIVGLPGDRLMQRDGKVWINGQPLDEPYLERASHWEKNFEAVVPARHYFMMGDNREQSCDSRDWGWVPKEKLAGPLLAIFSPSRLLRSR